MVKIRLARVGKRNKAFWRVGVFESSKRRDGKPIEYVGSYNPHAEKDEDKVQIDMKRVEHWLSHGAQPSTTVANLLDKAKATTEG